MAGIIINYYWMIFSIVDTDWFVSDTNGKFEVSTDKGEHY